MSSSSATTAAVIRRTALPLGCYYTITLALPMANGAAATAAFWEHAWTVLVVPPVGIAIAVVVCAIARACVPATGAGRCAAIVGQHEQSSAASCGLVAEEAAGGGEPAAFSRGIACRASEHQPHTELCAARLADGGDLTKGG